MACFSNLFLLHTSLLAALLGEVAGDLAACSLRLPPVSALSLQPALASRLCANFLGVHVGWPPDSSSALCLPLCILLHCAAPVFGTPALLQFLGPAVGCAWHQHWLDTCKARGVSCRAHIDGAKGHCKMDIGKTMTNANSKLRKQNIGLTWHLQCYISKSLPADVWRPMAKLRGANSA